MRYVLFTRVKPGPEIEIAVNPNTVTEIVPVSANECSLCVLPHQAVTSIRGSLSDVRYCLEMGTDWKDYVRHKPPKDETAR